MALPNILEDRLLADAADCHFAFNIPRGGTGTTTIAAQPKMPVAVIDRGILTRALDVVTEAGFKVRRPTARFTPYRPPQPVCCRFGSTATAALRARQRTDGLRSS